MRTTDFSGYKEITSEEQRKLQLDLLLDIDRICSKYQIKYTLGGGSLLGAIRHKGFIPWDDDIDVFMLRQDYNRFLEVYPKDSDEYRLLDLSLDSEYNYTFAKLINDDTILVERIDSGIQLGVCVDIFPIDNCPNDYSDALKFMKSFKLLRWASNAKAVRVNKKRALWKNVILVMGKVLVAPFSQKWISEKISHKAQRFNNIDTNYVGELAINPYMDREIWKKSWFDSYISVEFEGELIKVSKDYDLLLTKTFGDYLKLPPVDKQITHHDYECYWKKKD